MQAIHTPKLGWHYWALITLASVFGTNLGDLYADKAGLGVLAGIAILAVFAGAVFAIERRDSVPRVIYYWVVILIIRTGATNIADYLAWELEIPPVPLSLALAATIGGFGWLSLRHRPSAADVDNLPSTGFAYWLAMLGAGVFGTVVGDNVQVALGQPLASIVLTALLTGTLAVWHFGVSMRFWIYWLVVAVARTAGTAVGDLFAEGDVANIGLPLSTLMTGCCFVIALVVWPPRPSRLVQP